MEVENNLEIIKKDHNAAWEIYKEPFTTMCRVIAYRKNLEKDDLYSYAYIKFVEACERYDPNYNGKFKSFAAYSYGYIQQRLLAYAQRYYIKYNREIVRDLSITENDDGIEYQVGVEDKFNLQEYTTLKQDLHDFLETIPELHKNIYKLIALGYTQHEIAKMLNMSQSRVCNTVKEARIFYDKLKNGKKCWLLRGNKQKIKAYKYIKNYIQ